MNEQFLIAKLDVHQKIELLQLGVMKTHISSLKNQRRNLRKAKQYLTAKVYATIDTKLTEEIDQYQRKIDVLENRLWKNLNV